MKNDYSAMIARATPPEILFRDDLGALLHIPPSEAEMQARSGRFGPAFYVHGRVAVLREDLVSALRQRAGAPEAGDREVLP